MRYSLLFAVVLIMTIAASASWEVVIQPSSYDGNDTFISSDVADTNYGELVSMYVGKFTGITLQSLIHFSDVDNYNGETVISATLSLYFTVTIPIAGADLYMAKIIESWDQGDVTWNTVPNYEPDYYTFLYPVSTSGDWKDYNVTTIVSDWLDGTSTNYGLILYTDNSINHNAYAATCEYTEPTYRPKLTIVFEGDNSVESSSLGGIKAVFK